ncbi:MAG: hypothetical protein JW704_07030 [Anaerolineaceae bacterium]|nr:hypothetical protein [Anaerolineaceae bacterium]
MNDFEDNIPDFMKPENDRKTPYTEEELDLLVEGFLDGFDDHDGLRKMINEQGLDEVKKGLREQFRRMDPNFVTRN